MRDVMPTHTTSFVALLKREWQEHRTALVFPPAAVLAILVFAIVIAALFSERIAVDIDLDDHAQEFPALPPALQGLQPRDRTQLFMVDAAPLPSANFA